MKQRYIELKKVMRYHTYAWRRECFSGAQFVPAVNPLPSASGECKFGPRSRGLSQISVSLVRIWHFSVYSVCTCIDGVRIRRVHRFPVPRERQPSGKPVGCSIEMIGLVLRRCFWDHGHTMRSDKTLTPSRTLKRVPVDRPPYFL